jgi:hypothetical protein
VVRHEDRYMVALGLAQTVCIAGKAYLHRAAVHSIGGGRMNNLEIAEILEIGVIGIAVAQALTILLTNIRGSRDWVYPTARKLPCC